MVGREVIPLPAEPFDEARFERDRQRVEAGFWQKLRQSLGRIPFVEDAVAAYYCAFDPETPLQVKAVLIAALAYFVLPMDMVPDVIAGFGFTDDAAVLYAAITAVQRHLRPQHRAKARAVLKSGSDPLAENPRPL
jgi:uncharacterized membrane protein YkvA (DUF1232 family)